MFFWWTQNFFHQLQKLCFKRNTLYFHPIVSYTVFGHTFPPQDLCLCVCVTSQFVTLHFCMLSIDLSQICIDIFMKQIVQFELVSIYSWRKTWIKIAGTRLPGALIPCVFCDGSSYGFSFSLYSKSISCKRESIFISSQMLSSKHRKKKLFLLTRYTFPMKNESNNVRLE